MCLIYPSNSHSDFHKAFSRRDILLITHFPLTFCLTIWQSYWPLSKCWNSPDLGTLDCCLFPPALHGKHTHQPTELICSHLLQLHFLHQLVTVHSLPNRMLPIHVRAAILEPSSFPLVRAVHRTLLMCQKDLAGPRWRL